LDSAFYNHSVITAILTGRAQFSITARMDRAVQKAISGIPDDAWVSIEYPEAIFDEEQQRWISDAKVAEIDYTAFTSKAKRHRVTARLIVRRVKRLNPKSARRVRTTVRRVPAPRRVHQLDRADAACRGPPPGSRHRGTGHRRLEKLCHGALSVSPG
jgi:hypothetical protein